MSGGHHFARHEGINQVQVAGKLGLSSATLHLALRIVDLFMDGHDIQVGITQIDVNLLAMFFLLSGATVIPGVSWGVAVGKQDGGEVTIYSSAG